MQGEATVKSEKAQVGLAAKRSRSGCLTCRRRKKKCDETLCPETGGCWRCRNAGYQCEGFRRAPVIFEPKSKPRATSSSSATGASPTFPVQNGELSSASRETNAAQSSSFPIPSSSHQQSLWANLRFAHTRPDPAANPFSPEQLSNPEGIELDDSQAKTRPCEIVGDCLFSGRHLCALCNATASRLIGTDGATNGFESEQELFSRPAQSIGNPTPPLSSEKRDQLVLESLIGYYATLITCWVEGCDAKGLGNSRLFPRLINLMLEHTQHDPPLRLSVAAVTAGYVGGARLQWPPDVSAVHRWASTLRHDRASIGDCVRANLSIPASSSPATNSPSGTASTARSDLLVSPGKRKSPHTTLDELLVGQAQTLKYLTICSLEEVVTSFRFNKNYQMLGLSSEDEFLSKVAEANLPILSGINLAIYAFAEDNVDSFLVKYRRLQGIIDTLLGPLPPVNLTKLTKLEHLAFLSFISADVAVAVATGSKPHVTLRMDSNATGTRAADSILDSPFSAPDLILINLSEIAKLRYELDGGDYMRGKQRAPGAKLPDSALDQAQRIESSLRSCSITQTNRIGSSICAEMLKHASLIFLYTTVYRVGPLHPVCRSALREILYLWPSAEAYCRSIGCSNFNIPIFLAATVAVDEKDREVCKKAMHIVGHEEAAANQGRELVDQLWSDSDRLGVPLFWTEMVASSQFQVAFF